MKIVVVFIFLMSTKSVLGFHGRLSHEMLPSFRRRPLPLDHYQRGRSNMAGPIFLKQLLLNRLLSVYNQNCLNEQKLIPCQKLPTRFHVLPGFRYNIIYPGKRNPVITNGIGTRYFIKPNVIIVPPLRKIVKPTENSFQKKVISRKNLSQDSRTVSKNRENGENKEIADTKKGESFRTEILRDFKPYLGNSTRNTSKSGENQTVSVGARVPGGFLHPNSIKHETVTYPETTSNSFSLLRPNLTQTYEVEEIFEDTINIEDDFDKMNANEGAYFGNKLQSDKEEQVMENSLKSIIREIGGLNSQTTENILTVPPGDTGRTKAPSAETSAPGQFQNIKILQSGKKGLINGTETPLNLKTLKDGSRRGIIQHSDRFYKLGKEQEVLKPVNEIHGTPSVSTNGVTYDEEKKQTTESNFFETIFGLFTKKPFPNTGGKPVANPKKLDLNSIGLLQNLPNRNSDNLVKNDSELELMSSTTANSAITTSTQVDSATSHHFIPSISSLSEFPVSETTAEINTVTSRIPEGRQIPQISSADMVLLNPDLTTPNFEEFPDKSLFIDLFSPTIKPDLKKDQESHGKNSRKLHFNQDTLINEITFNGITDKSDQEPRRSDILITDDVNEYKDRENRHSALSYLERIKPKDATSTDDFLSNVNMESYIPLMLEILNDIREDKISQQDLSLLSSVFGKFWPNILELANNTKLDVLPLATMKSEKDFVAFMESNFSNRSETFTTEAQFDDKDEFKQAYDYEYKDFYGYS